MKKSLIFWLFVASIVFLLNKLCQGSLNLLVFETSDSMYAIYKLMIYIVLVAFVFLYQNPIDSYEKKTITRKAVIFSAICIISSILNLSANSLNDFFVIILNLISLPIALSAGYKLSRLKDDKTKDVLLLVLQIPAFVSAYTILSQPFGVKPDVAFSVAVFMPFSFCMSKRWRTYLLLIFYIFIYFLAAKRAILGVAIACTSILFIYDIFFSKAKVLSWQMFFTLMTIIGGILYLANQSDAITHTIDRFATLEDNIGNGRDEIYTYIFSSESNASVTQLMLGNGYFSVLKDFGKHAHNDFLEIMYDFGIFALIAYVVFLCQIVKVMRHRFLNTQTRHNTIYLFLVLLTFLILGFSNSILCSNFLELSLSLSLGYMLAVAEEKT